AGRVRQVRHQSAHRGPAGEGVLVRIGQQPGDRDPGDAQLLGAHPGGVQQVLRRAAAGGQGRGGAGARVAAPAQQSCEGAQQALPVAGVGKSPSGLPLPSQLSRLIRTPSGRSTAPSWRLVAKPGPDMPIDSSGSDMLMPGPRGAFSGQSVPVDSRSCAVSWWPTGITYRSSYFAIASSRYISCIVSPSMPTAFAIPSRGGLPRLMSRMYERIAAIRYSTRSTVGTSPAVKRFARYSTGIRSASIAANRLSASSAS